MAKMLTSQGHPIWILSGRSDRTKDATIDWLKKHDVPFDHLDQLFNFYKGLRTLLASVGVIYMENKQMVLIKKENIFFTISK